VKGPLLPNTSQRGFFPPPAGEEPRTLPRPRVRRPDMTGALLTLSVSAVVVMSVPASRMLRAVLPAYQARSRRRTLRESLGDLRRICIYTCNNFCIYTCNAA
jgi:hypothetical protein